MFSTLSKRNFNFSVTFILSSANALKLDQCKILSFGKELSLYQRKILDSFKLDENSKSTPNGYKTLWEKEKLLVMSTFSFSHSVLKLLFLKTCKNQCLFGKRLKNGKKVQDVFVKHGCPCSSHLFENCDLDI